MKVVLFALNSSYVHTNLAVRCLKNYAEQQLPDKHEIIIVENNLKDKFDEVLYSLYSLKADVYAFSCYIYNIREILFYAGGLKSLLPDSLIILGGPEVSYDAEDLLKNHTFIDYVIINEGEEVFAEFLEKGSDEKIIDGKIFGKFTQTGIQYSVNETISGNIAYYESSRGCPYKCSYCLSSRISGIRAKTVSHTLQDLLEFEKFSTVSTIKFVDRTFNYDMKRAKDIFQGLLSEKYTKTYHMEMRPELFDEEMFCILEKFPKGKLQMEIGIQSTDNKVLLAIDRPSDIEKAIRNMKKLRKLGNINVHADLIAGLPYDDISSVRESYNSLFYVCDRLQLGFLKLLKGTKIRKEKDKYAYKFNMNAPYDVYENRFISFDEISSLKRVAALTERYKNSVHFERTIEYITGFSLSPFDFFVGLDRHINRHISSVSQENAFKALYEFSKKEIKSGMTDKEWSDFIDYLKEDYSGCLNRQAPVSYT